MKFYFRKLSHINPLRFTAPALSGSIGGYMGLLIGASVITVFEFLDFILVTTATYLAKYLAQKRLKRNRITGTERRGKESPGTEVQSYSISK